MDKVSKIILKCLRHSFQGIFGLPSYQPIPLPSIEKGNDIIFKMLTKGEPCMIARYGSNELTCILNYLEIKYGHHNIWENIKGLSPDWWWNEGMMRLMRDVAGFFPVTDQYLSMFSELMIEDSKYVDALAIFPPIKRGISKMKSYINPNTLFFPLASFDAFLQNDPWTKYLKEKKVLVIHPFKELIEIQYHKRKILFKNPDVLPDFDLITLKSVQSVGGINDQGFNTWFEGLDWMKTEIDKVDFDVALIGCGAYGFPLAAYIKRQGKQAVHIGGKLQLFFGIKGKRWENPNYGVNYGIPHGTYIELMNNPEWVRPEQYRTKQSENVEGACYW